jgi:hypothetical protein
MMILQQFGVLRSTLIEMADSISEEKLTVIPAGFNNHILWNLGHLAVTQQILVYLLSGNEVSFDKQTLADFRKGSAPKIWTTEYSYAQVRGWLLEQSEKLNADYAAGKFTNYKEYATSTGIVLKTVDDALAYNQFHEGLHMGVVQAMKKLV